MEQNFTANEIGKAMSRAGLPFDHAIRAELEQRATILSGREPAVRVDGKSLDDATAQLRRDPKIRRDVRAAAENPGSQ